MTDFRDVARGAFDVAMVGQPFISAAMGLAITFYIVHRLFCCSAQYNRAERVGMGLVAGGMVMATPALWMIGTPFDQWSYNVARAGIALYIITGGLRRDRHHKRNLAQLAYWDGYRDGKLRAGGKEPAA